MTRVGFIINASWLGGINYFRNLLCALHELPDRKIDPVIITGRRVDPNHLSGFPPFEHFRTGLVDRRTIPWFARGLLLISNTRDFLLERFLTGHDISVLSHSGYLGEGSQVPTLGWIPDFQHKRLPNFSTPRENARRDREFANLCRHCTRVIVSSHDALNDLKTFYPNCAPKARVLQFVASAPDIRDLPSQNEIAQKYGLSSSFFFLPNQFWAHKNHRVVLEALHILKNNGHNIQVAVTGNPDDYRSPGFFDSLMRMARELGVSENFRVLGLVPYADLMSLMNGALAVINPSLFEGWSTTVEEAKSLGKYVILSDIPVHREQAPDGGIYFDPHNGESLAQAFLTFLSSYPSAAADDLRDRARLAFETRRTAFARAYQDIVSEVLQSTSDR